VYAGAGCGPTPRTVCAAHQPRVKRVVIASSIAAVIDISQGFREGYTYTEKDWNPVTWEQLKAIGDPHLAYATSKKVAEKAAWDFMDANKPHFALTTICPPMVFGSPLQPVENMKGLNQSSEDRNPVRREQEGDTVWHFAASMDRCARCGQAVRRLALETRNGQPALPRHPWALAV